MNVERRRYDKAGEKIASGMVLWCLWRPSRGLIRNKENENPAGEKITTGGEKSRKQNLGVIDSGRSTARLFQEEKKPPTVSTAAVFYYECIFL